MRSCPQSFLTEKQNTASQDHRETVFSSTAFLAGPEYVDPGRYRAPTFHVIEAPGVIADPVTLHTDQFKVLAVT